MYLWQRFDLGEIREDAARIKGLGLHAVRFFLHWEDFQPQADRIDSTMLDRLVKVMDVWHDAALLAMPTLFTGHMSGVNFIPAWALDSSTHNGRFRTITNRGESAHGIGDFYTGRLLDAQVLHVREAGKALAGHPALFAWDLGNEFSNLREPNSPHDAADWSRRLTDALQQASGKGVTGGTHGEDITRERNIRPSSICAPWIFPTMHGYSVYSAFARNRLDPDVVPFLCQLMSSCTGRAVLFSEFGNPTCKPGTVSPYDRVPLPGEVVEMAQHLPDNACDYACLNEEEMCDYGYSVLDGLHRAGALGGYWWCYADYSGEITALPPFDKAAHELSFGIVRSDGSEKPIAGTLRRFAAEQRQTLEVPAPIVNEAAYFAGLPNTIDSAYTTYVRRDVHA